jgi:hypothetical protein
MGLAYCICCCSRDLSEYASGQWSVKSKDLDFKVPVPSQHHTPLHIAAEQGDQAVMCLLLGAGARLDVRDSAGSTALHLALEAEVGGQVGVAGTGRMPV